MPIRPRALDAGAAVAPFPARELPEPEGGTDPLERSGERLTLAAQARIARGRPAPVGQEAAAERYRRVKLLGEGGMGEVHLCEDQRISRQIAMKVMHAAPGKDDAERARFVREALVQGQLEHPAIVPVHDVGQDRDGGLFFTMRRVRGTTLEEILDELRRGSAPFEQKYSRRKLLSALSNVCLAVDYAHTSAVFHCDLKPANIMLGSFGEVYVLDWGLARRGDEEVSLTAEPCGTPGFMAPELVRALAPDARTDVYGLGAVLYELLTLQPLHPGTDPRELLLSTLRGKSPRPTACTPQRDIPPELEAICIKATALDPRDRYASARELSDQIERYLEGDRDLSLRRAMSQEHAARAKSSAERAAVGGPDATAAMEDAMRGVGRALALDPDNGDALQTLVQVLTKPPTETPEEAKADMAAEERSFERVRARMGAIAFLSWVLFLPVMFVVGVRNLGMLLLCTGAWVGVGLMLLYLSYRPRADGFAHPIEPIAASVAIGMSSLVFGPLVLTPAFATVFALAFSLAMPRRHRFLPAVVGALSMLVPEALQIAHILPRSVSYANGGMHILPVMTDFSWLGHYNLLLGHVACVVVACCFGLKLRARLDENQRRVYLNNWQLRQLLPREARAASSVPPP